MQTPLIWLLSAFCISIVDSSAWAQTTPQTTLQTAETQPQAEAKQTPLDSSVELKSQEQVSTVFRDMVVVQRKAKEKRNKILGNVSTSFDFSDGPNTMYGINTNLGYALSDFFEVYLNYVPVFLVSDRPIVKKVNDLTLANGKQARITYSKPKSQYGAEFLWIPAYGKDSWGPYSIVRSDTFFKLGIGQVQYEAGTGMRYSFMLGKTFFLSQWFNLRLAAGVNQVETIVDDKKSPTVMAALEAGLVFYF